jgi:hypothetical protein
MYVLCTEENVHASHISWVLHRVETDAFDVFDGVQGAVVGFHWLLVHLTEKFFGLEK